VVGSSQEDASDSTYTHTRIHTYTHTHIHTCTHTHMHRVGSSQEDASDSATGTTFDEDAILLEYRDFRIQHAI
jgi:hypothetical protein